MTSSLSNLIATEVARLERNGNRNAIPCAWSRMISTETDEAGDVRVVMSESSALLLLEVLSKVTTKEG